MSTAFGKGVSASSGDGGQATAAAFKDSESVFADSVGRLFVAERYGNKVRSSNSINFVPVYVYAVLTERSCVCRCG